MAKATTQSIEPLIADLANFFSIENIAFSVARLYHQEKNYRNYFEKMLKVLRKEGRFEQGI